MPTESMAYHFRSMPGPLTYAVEKGYPDPARFIDDLGD